MHPEDGTISLALKEQAFLELRNLYSRHIFNLEQVSLQTSGNCGLTYQAKQ